MFPAWSYIYAVRERESMCIRRLRCAYVYNAIRHSAQARIIHSMIGRAATTDAIYVVVLLGLVLLVGMARAYQGKILLASSHRFIPLSLGVLLLLSSRSLIISPRQAA